MMEGVGSGKPQGGLLEIIWLKTNMLEKWEETLGPVQGTFPGKDPS